MNSMIIPEIVPDVTTLRDILARELPPGSKIKIPPLNRKVISVAKSFGIVSEVRIRPDKIIVCNTMPTFLGLAIFFCLPFGIYLLCKMKDGETLRSTVHDVVWRATRKS